MVQSSGHLATESPFEKGEYKMTSPIEHFLVTLSSAIEKKHSDSDLAHYAKKVAQECSNAGFPGKDGFTMEYPNNKKIKNITEELEKKIT